MKHTYELALTWTGNRGTGTSGYRDYARDVLARADGRPDLELTAGPTFRGDRTKWNPEQQVHREAAEACFIASSVNFPVEHAPTTVVASVGPGPP